MDRLPAGNPVSARLLLALGKRGWKLPFRLACLIIGVELPCRDLGDLRLPHPIGIVVHSRTNFGKRVIVYQNVTIASHLRKDEAAIIEDDVLVGAGAVLVGPVRIGQGATVGANAVVTEDVPAGVTVVGAPAKPVPSSRYKRNSTEP